MKIEAPKKEDQNYSICYIMAVICGIATAYVVTGSIVYMLLGAILGLLTAVFFVNVIFKSSKS